MNNPGKPGLTGVRAQLAKAIEAEMSASGLNFERALAEAGVELPERFELFDKNILFLGYQHQSYAFRDGARRIEEPSRA